VPVEVRVKGRAERLERWGRTWRVYLIDYPWRRGEIADWIKENVEGNFKICEPHVRFGRESDALLFYLRFS
jgi:hypothetical protein